MRLSATLGLLTAVLSASIACAGPPAEGVQWIDNIFEAHKQAQAANKPMLVVFGADWCTFCKKLERQTINTPQMSQYINQSFIAVHLDADKDKQVAKILEVESLPCTVVLSPNADLLARIEGYHTVGPFYQKLAAARQLHVQGVQQTSSVE